MIKMRVKEGKRALPYNDGYKSDFHQPGEIFEGPARFLVEFSGHVEQVGDDGQVIDSNNDVATQAALASAQPHERVSMLNDLKAKREAAQKAELAAFDKQIADEQVKAEKAAAERSAKAAQPAASASASDVEVING